MPKNLIPTNKKKKICDPIIKKITQKSTAAILKKLQGTLNIPEKDQLIEEIYQKRREPHDSP